MKTSKYIDHTLLKANAAKEQIETLCREALEHDFASVCVNSYWVKTCAQMLKGSDVKVCTVVGFPLGAMSTKAKAFETACAIEDGADEIDMVINIGELKAGNEEAVENDIRAVVEAAKGRTVKNILETCLLSDEEIIKACIISVKAGCAFVKTSTGFSTGGADPRIVKLMKDTVTGKALVKAAGGIRTPEDFKTMIDAGADRIGTSNGVSLLTK